MEIKIYLTKEQANKLIELNESEGARLTNEEYAQEIFNDALWSKYHKYERENNV